MIEKEIPGFERYTIDQSGTVRNREMVIMKSNGVQYTQKRKIKKPVINCQHGRYMFTLRDNNGNVVGAIRSRLVALTFIPNPENKQDVNHINGIKTDDRVENLEWMTRGENIRHAFKMNLMPRRRGKDHYMYTHGQSKTKEYQRAWHRVTNRGYDWNALTDAQRSEIANSPKLSRHGRSI